MRSLLRVDATGAYLGGGASAPSPFQRTLIFYFFCRFTNFVFQNIKI